VLDLILDPIAWYSVAAAACLVLGVYVWLADSSGLIKTQLLVLSAAGITWNLHFVLRSGDPGLFSLDMRGFAVETVMLMAWFIVLHRLLRGPYKKSMPETVRRFLYLYWGLVLLAGAAVAWFEVSGGSLVRVAGYYNVLALGMALACFALAAQLLRDTPVESPAALQFFSAGAGIFSGAQILLTGTAVLGGTAPAGVSLVSGIASVIAAVAVLAAVRQRPQWSLEIFVSPQARTYAPRLLAMMAVLLLVLVLLPVFRSMHPESAQSLAVLLITSAGLPISVLLFSETVSARLRVFFSKHFLPFRYDYREEWLRLIDTLASPDSRLPLRERIIKAVAQIVGSPAGLLWMQHADGDAFVCSANWNTRMWSDVRVAADDPVLRFMCQRQWILDTAELMRDPGLYDGLQRPVWLDSFPEALLVVPLINNERLIAFLILFQSSSAFRLTFEEIDLLRTSGRQVAVHLAQYEADQQLAEAKQFEAFNRLTAFVMHDLKNLIAQQSLVVKNAAKHKNNPAFFEDAVATVDNSVGRMNKLLQQLQSGDAAGPRQRVRLAAAISDAVGKCCNRDPVPQWQVEHEDLFAQVDRERFTSILAHLIRNAQEATRADGNVTIRLERDNGGSVITIEDDGCGMEPEFVRDRLFRPFDSTKGSKGMGIGAYQARTLVVESGGYVDVDSSPGRGTRFVIALPADESAGTS